MDQLDLSCPQCRRDDFVHKASAIVGAGTSVGCDEGDTTRAAVGFDGGAYARGYSAGQGIQHTILSRKLAPPSPPVYVSPWKHLWLFLVAPGIIWALAATDDNTGMDIVCALVCAAIIAGHGYAQRTAQQRYAEQWYAFQEDWRTWAHIYYCHRCDGVFIPGMQTLMAL